MKIIFVGVHNKVGKLPLCSSTKSGKLIDQIIDKHLINDVRIALCLKTNLYNLEYLPPQDIKEQEAVLFYYRVQPNEQDVFVLLGAEVAKNFFNKGAHNVVEIHHPASKRSHEDMNEYVLDAVEKITNKINALNES
jgi:hypothetical protein